MTPRAATHGRYVLIETMTGAAINVVLSLVAAIALSGIQFSGPAVTAARIASGLAPEILMTTLMSVLVPTVLTHARRRNGRLPAIDGGAARALPHPLLRAALAGFAVSLIVLPVLMLMLPLLVPAGLDASVVLIVDTGVAVLLSIVVIPVAENVALRERLPARRQAFLAPRTSSSSRISSES